MEETASADHAANDKKDAKSTSTPRIQIRVSVSSDTCNRSRDTPFNAIIKLINLEEVPVTLHRERDNQVFKLPGALHDHSRPFVFRHLATGKTMSTTTRDICYYCNSKPEVEQFFTIPAKGTWQYSGQLNDWGGSESNSSLGKSFVDSLHTLEPGEMYRFEVKEGLKVAWWEYGESDEIFDVVMWEIAQGGKPEKPSPVVLEVVRSKHDTFTMAD